MGLSSRASAGAPAHQGPLSKTAYTSQAAANTASAPSSQYSAAHQKAR